MYLEYYVGRVSTYFSNFPREGGHETGTASLPVSRLPVSDFPGRDETLPVEESGYPIDTLNPIFLDFGRFGAHYLFFSV